MSQCATSIVVVRRSFQVEAAFARLWHFATQDGGTAQKVENAIAQSSLKISR